jgi:hypothetical protein
MVGEMPLYRNPLKTEVAFIDDSRKSALASLYNKE